MSLLCRVNKCPIWYFLLLERIFEHPMYCVAQGWMSFKGFSLVFCISCLRKGFRFMDNISWMSGPFKTLLPIIECVAYIYERVWTSFNWFLFALPPVEVTGPWLALAVLKVKLLAWSFFPGRVGSLCLSLPATGSLLGDYRARQCLLSYFTTKVSCKKWLTKCNMWKIRNRFWFYKFNIFIIFADSCKGFFLLLYN